MKLGFQLDACLVSLEPDALAISNHKDGWAYSTLELQTKCNFAKQFNKNFSGNVTKKENRVSVIVGNTSFRKNTEVK